MARRASDFRHLCWLVTVASGVLPSRFGLANEPLNARIDAVVEAGDVGQAVPPATDAEFLRRVSLDLTGRIPSAAAARAFLDDASSDKRTALIDRLLASADYVRHMAVTFDVMLMERRGDQHVPAADWQKYLLDSFAANKPLDQLAREILSADGADEKIRPAAKFYLERDGDPNLLTRDVGRIFFGRDLQCCQCHDHPLIPHYLQQDYHEIFAFFNRSFLFTDNTAKKSFLAEKAEGDVTFKSAFTEVTGATGPRVPGGRTIDEPQLPPGEEYVVKPDKDVRPVPKYSRREQLAKSATEGNCRALSRNMANRLWSHMMGRGLVEPADLHHPDNPPTHPQLLDLLDDEFVVLKFDVKAFLRELALTRTYQRSFQMPADLAERAAAAQAKASELEAEKARLADAAAQAKESLAKARAELAEARKQFEPIAAEFATARGAWAEAKKASDAAAAALAASQQQLAAKQDVAKSLSAAAAAAQLAATKLPEDKELAAAAEKFKAKSDQVTAELPALEKDVADKSAPANAAGANLAQSQQVAEAVLARLTEAKQKLQPFAEQLDAAIASHQAAHAAAVHADHRLADARMLVEYASAVAVMSAARVAVEKLQADLVAAKQAVATLSADLPKRQEELAAAQTANSQAAKSLDDVKLQFATKQETAKVVAEASTKAAEAAQKLPNDQELATAAAQVKARHDQLAAEVAELQKTLTTSEETAKLAADRLAASQKALESYTAQLASAQQAIPALESQLPPLIERAEGERTKQDAALADLTTRWSNTFAISPLSSLTPEQLAWSMMQALGVVDAQRPSSEAEVSKTLPLTDEIKNDPAKVAERDRLIEAHMFEALKGYVAQFVGLFGGAAGQPQTEFFATVDQALYFANGGTVQAWLTGGGYLPDRLAKLDDAKAIAEELYLSVLTRRPTDQESAAVVQYVTARPNEKVDTVRELTWALLTSAEFRFSH